MTITTRWTCSLTIIAAVSVAAAAAGAQVRVTGHVLDSSGAAMAHAEAEAIPKTPEGNKPSFGDRPSPWVTVDENGAFTLTLPPGKYKLRAKDESSGYPDPVYWLNADPTAMFPEITVAEDEREVQGVQIVLGKKGGVLSGQLLNADSQSPIKNAKISIRDSQNSSAFVEIFTDTNGHFQFTVPSKPVIVAASCSGYRSVGPASSADVLLSPGEHRSIVLELKPIS